MRLLAGMLLLLYFGAGVAPASLQEEVLKLPSLWRHFKAHQAVSPDMTFHAFWQLHYGEKYHSHRFAHDHSDLPGKSGHQHQHFCCFQPFVLPPAMPLFFLNEPLTARAKKTFGDPNRPAGLSVEDIWQPPKAF